MHRQSRRNFLMTGAAAAAAAALPLRAAKRSATDLVALGNSGVQVTRLAFGTGTFGGRVQRELGQDEFTRLVRHAYDSGIRFFETAESYRGMPQMLATALKGIPRDSYKLMTKKRVAADDGRDPRQVIESFRSDLNTDYFDIMLIHCVRSPKWPEETLRLQDALSEAKQKKMVLAHGASVHGLQALRAFPGNKWLDVALLRTNHTGARMDNMDLKDTPVPGDVNEVISHAKKIHSQGAGVLGMKLVAEGQFAKSEDREAAMKYVMGLGCVDAVTIGYKNTSEIDDAIARMNRALNS